MVMLIRSQDKETIVNLGNVTNLFIKDNKMICVMYPHTINNTPAFETLGLYSDVQKCIKVLDMIQNAYETSIYSDDAFDYSAQVQRPYIFMNNRVFQMPDDREVNV